MSDPQEPRIADELRKMEHEPLLPVEKKLIGWSVSIGLVLLAVLLLIGSLVRG